MVTKLKSFVHYVKIDHWEKDEWGDTFMVDVCKRKWIKHLWRSGNYRHYPESNQREIIRTMKQNRKIIKFYTFHSETISDKWFTDGHTMSFEDAAKDFINGGHEKLAKDSCDTVLELLLE